MAVTKTITIDGKQVAFRASGALPRIYRLRFGRDIFIDMENLDAAVKRNDEHASTLSVEMLTQFEDIAWLMAKHADPAVPDTVEEWLDGFNTLSIYQLLPHITELWGLNIKTTAKAKKKSVPQTGS